MKRLFFLFLLLSTCLASQGQKHAFYGTVRDASSGESLPGASVIVKGTSYGTVSNNYGFYSLSLYPGTFEISCSFIGYADGSFTLKLTRDTLINISLQPSTKSLSEVVVSDRSSDPVRSSLMSVHSLNLKTFRLTPSAAGEADPVKNLQLFPGIQTAGEGTTNLSVRGGSYDQNLFLLDDAPVYNPSHALGFFSTFNPDAIKSVKIYKTIFPAEYGGRLSSVIDIRMKDGNNETFNGSGGTGLVGTRLSLEGPLAKGKSSFIVSGRYSYAGLVANGAGLLGQALRISPLMDFEPNNEISFYDLNAKVNYGSGNDHFYLSAYTGHDHFYYFSIDNTSSMDWGNITGTARWNHVFSSKLFANTTLLFSSYNYSYILRQDARNFKWSAGMFEYDLKSDLDYFLNDRNHLKAGISVERHNYFPGKIEPRDSSSLTKPYELDRQQAVEASAYISNEQKIGERLRLVYGLRFSTFWLLGSGTVYSYSPGLNVIDSATYGKGELIQYYGRPEPRFESVYSLNENSSLKFSYAYCAQYQHLVSNSSVGMPTDIWMPSNRLLKPQYSNQFSLGYYRGKEGSSYSATAEIYYRQLGNIIDYRDNADLFLNNHIETQFLSGSGESYGAEFMVEKKKGKVTGWLSYTLSKTTRTIEGINDGMPYPANYDKRHNLAIVMFWKMSESWDFSSVFKYTSGGFITVPEGAFQYYGAAFNYYTNRNGYKLPPYHRLDISFTYRNPKKQQKRWKPEWNFGVYNVYDHKNLFSMFIRMSDYDFSAPQAYMMYLYGITPFVSYNYKF